MMPEPSHPPDGSTSVGNPVLPVYAADPDAHLFGDRYYIYATNAGFYPDKESFEKNQGEAHGFAAWSSPDLRTWTSEGPILWFSEISWARDLANAWAPCVAARNGRYYFYFCADSRIGVAVGDSPTGPFEDALGRPLIDYRDDLSAIDPMVFVDDDGAAYLYWGAVPGHWLEPEIEYVRMHLSVQRLADDMVTLLGEERPTIFTGPALGSSPGEWASRDHIEASHVIQRNGTYHLMWSEGSFGSPDPEQSYRVRTATARSPWGPWHTATEPILDRRDDLGIIGPGHHGVIRIPGTDEWWCVYHHHPGDADRRVSIDALTFTEDGAIAPIVPTREGPSVRPVSLALTLEETGPFTAGVPIAFLFAARATFDRIELYAGETRIGEAAGDAERWTWAAPPIGFARVEARGTTADGGTVASSPLNLDVI